MEILERRGEQPDDRVQRRGDRAEYLSAKHVGRRQLRELLDRLAGHRLALEDAAANREHLRRPCRVGERLGNGDRVAIRLEEGDRGRPVEQRQHDVRPRSFGRAACKRVLDDGEARPVLEQLSAQRVDLLHRQPAVVRDDEGVRRLQPLGQVSDDLLLVLSQHFCSSNGSTRARRAGTSA